jgi:hypothetical protein
MEIHRSASKHGVPESDVLHAIEHEIVSMDLEPVADGQFQRSLHGEGSVKGGGALVVE